MKTEIEEKYKYYLAKDLIKRIRTEETEERKIDRCVALNLAIESLEKQVPQKVVGMHRSTNKEDEDVYGEDAKFGNCPSCKLLVCSVWNNEYCGDCGQRLDWSDEQEGE